MRSQAQSGLLYAFSELGMDFSLSQIENMEVYNVLTLLDGKDAGIRDRSPQNIRK
jgi:hypothetical protein